MLVSWNDRQFCKRSVAEWCRRDDAGNDRDEARAKAADVPVQLKGDDPLSGIRRQEEWRLDMVGGSSNSLPSTSSPAQTSNYKKRELLLQPMQFYFLYGPSQSVSTA